MHEQWVPGALLPVPNALSMNSWYEGKILHEDHGEVPYMDIRIVYS